jgi:predicted nucleic acid-binding protein
MAAGVLLDTSFLITLAGGQRPHHKAARRYWRHFIENQIPIYLSTIVVSEFCVKQEIDPQILRCCIVLPFNWDDAQRVATLDWRSLRPPGVERDALKDDIKIIAQAARMDAEFVITDDSESFYRYCETFRAAGKVSFKAIKLAHGFDPAFFNDGKREFGESLAGDSEPEQ